MAALLDRYGLSRQRAALQLEGLTFALADFTVRVARAVQAPQQQFLGLVLDVAYEPLPAAGPDATAVLQVRGGGGWSSGAASCDAVLRACGLVC